jgi:hypothetical protein
MGYKDRKSRKDKDKDKTQSSSSSSTYKAKKIDLRFTPMDTRSPYAQASFELVKDAILLKVKAMFED